MRKEISHIVLALRTAGLHTFAEEVTETADEGLNTRRELKKKAIDVAAGIRDSMGSILKDKLNPDMVEGATLDVEAVMELITGELDRIEDKLSKGIWDAMEAATQDWDKDNKKSPKEEFETSGDNDNDDNNDDLNFDNDDDLNFDNDDDLDLEE